MASIPNVRIAKPKGRPIQLRYTDPETGKEVRISTGVYDPIEAAEHKLELEAKLRLGIEAKPRKRKAGGLHMPWQEFRDRYTTGHLDQQRTRTAETMESRLNVAERIVKPKTLGDLCDSEALLDLQNRLLAGAESKRPRSPHGVKSHMASILAVLNWAELMGWVSAVPRLKPVKTSKLKQMKGRPVRLEEFERMQMATAGAVGVEAADSWNHVLLGIWESGLRIGEVMQVSWDDPNCIMPVWSRGSAPVLSIPASMQKNDTEESIPLVPGLERLLLETPESARSGWVFSPLSLQLRLGRKVGDTRPTAEWIGRVVTRIGKAAGVIVEPAVGKPGAKGYKPPKYASAHDLRRGFADRLVDAGVSERDLAAVMRHASVETTRKHYAPEQVQRTAGRLREKLATVPRYIRQPELT